MSTSLNEILQQVQITYGLQNLKTIFTKYQFGLEFQNIDVERKQRI